MVLKHPIFFSVKSACKKKISNVYYKCGQGSDNVDKRIWERSSVWLERMPVTHEVASSSLVVPAILKEPFKGSFFVFKRLGSSRLSWICSTLPEFRNSNTVAVCSICSLSGLTLCRPSANPLVVPAILRGFQTPSFLMQ